MDFGYRMERIQINNSSFKLNLPLQEELRDAYKGNRIRFPYWGRLWPSAIALAEYIAADVSVVTGKKVLELGAGLALPSMVASMHAAEVHATDKDGHAVQFIQQNILLNEIKNMSVAVLDWEELTETDSEVILLSDVNYDPGSFARLSALLNRLSEENKTILLSTPHRLAGKEFILSMLPLINHQHTMDIEWEGERTSISLFRIG